MLCAWALEMKMKRREMERRVTVVTERSCIVVLRKWKKKNGGVLGLRERGSESSVCEL